MQGCVSAIWDKISKEGLSEEGTFEQRPEKMKEQVMGQQYLQTFLGKNELGLFKKQHEGQCG